MHHADPKCQQQVLNEIQCEEYKSVDQGKSNTVCYARCCFILNTKKSNVIKSLIFNLFIRILLQWAFC